MQPIYLDYAATTPCEPQVAKIMQKHLCLDGVFANSGSRSHIYGWQAENSVERARNQIAAVLNAHITEIFFTSGATESNNLALNNAPLGEIISSQAEHSSVLQPLKKLAKINGQKVKLLKPNKFGEISLEQLKNSLGENTKMVSLMALNNELGNINPIYELGEFLNKEGILFHIDAAQAFGKIPLDAEKLKADFISICAHKIYGPKGIGAIFIRKSLQKKIDPQILGGAQELGLRGGTLAVHQIAAFGLAAEIAMHKMQEDLLHLHKLKSKFLQELKDIEYCENAYNKNKYPGILNLRFAGIYNEDLINSLPKLAFSLGSACNAGKTEASKVLIAIGLTQDEALSSVRFSFGRFTSLKEAKEAGALVQEAVYVLQKNSPITNY